LYIRKEHLLEQKEITFGREAIPVNYQGVINIFICAVEIYVWSEDNNASKIFDSSMSFPYNVWFEGTTKE
jgi:hypothetical protein